MKFLFIILALTSFYHAAAFPLPGSTIVGPGEPGTIIQGPKSKATVRGPTGKVILGGGETGVIHAKGRDGGVVGASGTSPGIVAASAPAEYVGISEQALVPAFTIQVAEVPDLVNAAEGYETYDNYYEHQQEHSPGYDSLGGYY